MSGWDPRVKRLVAVLAVVVVLGAVLGNRAMEFYREYPVVSAVAVLVAVVVALEFIRDG